MKSDEFVRELLGPIQEFCRSLDGQPPAYSYIPLRSDEERIRVMQSRLFNELRAADLYGTWLRTTPELDVKATMAESAHEEMTHAQLLSRRIGELGHEPFDYKPLPAQIAMFNAMEGLNDTCERVAGLSLAGETVAYYLIQMCLKSPAVPDWIKQPYRRITEDEAEHGSIPQKFLTQYATTPERQDRVRRAVAMRMVLFREYLASLDRWAMGKASW
ncbi:MAG: ferritin-like domain-containing protein [Deltaproteobacteria bacterium]|nr:ferritin-like domain-containing protein [Deltaproteobacteria bacterium]MBI2991187.1 ferritin-like domain-containing protein [Deltaproteobacteria bacterium]MBI3061364.1 ferritin-like domain-containing protein [Deltaproteobacteria bacterium]